MVDRSATAELASLKSVAAFWELLTRCGKFLPDPNSKYVTEKQLLLVQRAQIFAMEQSQVVFRVCVKPPSKEVLVQKLLGYLETLKIPSGISTHKPNYPDKAWLVLAIATVSQGRDEIFSRDYLPPRDPAKLLVAPVVQQLDPIFQNVPAHLIGHGKGRHLKIGGLTKEEKLDLQIKRQEARILKQQAQQQKLVNDLQISKNQGLLKQRQQEQEREQMRREISRDMEAQAQAYLEQQIELEKQKLHSEFDSELQARVSALGLQSKGSHAPLLEMADEASRDVFQMPGGALGLRNLQSNTANMIRNRSSMSSDEE
jgi:hypothetical protein